MEQWAAALRPPSMQRAYMEAPHTGDRIHMNRHREVHRSLVRQPQGECPVAKSKLGPRQHNGVGLARATPARAGGEGGSAARTSRDGFHMAGDIEVSPTLSLHRKPHTYTRGACYTHIPDVHLYPWVDIPAIAF